MSPTPVPSEEVLALRHFNRYYTRRIAVLGPYLEADMTLADNRVLYELAHASSSSAELTASFLCRHLGLDPGYLSRILRKMEQKGWVMKTPSSADARRNVLSLTEKGRAAYRPLEASTNAEVAGMLQPLSPDDRHRLLQAMQTIETILDPAPTPAQLATPEATPAPKPRDIALRDLQPGDLGWVLQQHGELYWAEYGWGANFERLCAQILGEFAPSARERAWIATVGGERRGCIFLVKAPTTAATTSPPSPAAEEDVEMDSSTGGMAKIRLVLVHPAARGLGLASRLVDACLAFARGRGYRGVELWTHANLIPARKLYASRGFVQKSAEPYVGFGGNELVSESWELLF